MKKIFLKSLKKYFNNYKGIALLMVLWVLVLLMVLVFSFSYMTRIEIDSEIFFSERLTNDFLFEGAINRAVIEILYAKRYPNEKNIWNLYGTPNKGDIDGTTYFVKIIPELSRVDLNYAPDVILKGLLKNIGVNEERANIIIDSLRDWQDRDNLHRLYGAEDEYYQSLIRPYRCKNDNLNSVEEIMLIKGIDEELFYGNNKRVGLKDLVTVYTNSKKININSASKEVLLAIPGFSEDMVNTVMEYRKKNLFKSITEISSILGDAYSSVSPYITLSEGNTYRILVYTEKNKFATEAVVRVNTLNYEILYWKKSIYDSSEKSNNKENSL